MKPQMHCKKFLIPHKWLSCPRRSSLIADKFIVCKTLLDGRYDSQMTEGNRFNWKLLNGSVQSKYGRKIGMVIDLTNSYRFYDKKEVERGGCRYVKIACKGFEERPTPEAVNEFIQVVQTFNRSFPQQIICVHCTHGFNRSGFMIVSFLCNVKQLDLETSINTFAKARAPGIYKEDYLTDLCKRYGNGTQRFVTPQLPDWCKEDGSGNLIKLKETKFMDGMIPNVDNVTDIKVIQDIQSIVTSMCGWKDRRFPGSQPVTMNVENVQKLTTKNYKVTWKADGQRYMMLIKGRNEIFMLDRDLAVYRVNNVIFPRRKIPDDHLTNTLLDGEMVIDRYPDSKRGRYLVYDIIKFDGQEVCKMNLDIRFTCIALEIIQPRTKHFEKRLADYGKEPFCILQKKFWDISHARNLLDGDFTKKLLHETDGLIFQPLDDIYHFGQCREVLKWKPPELDSIDFKLIIETRPGEGPTGKLMVGGLNPSFATIDVTPQLRKYDKKIIECSWDFGKKVWKFMRERTDKSFPNRIETAQSIMKSIKNPLTKDSLYTVIETQRFGLNAATNTNALRRPVQTDVPPPTVPTAPIQPPTISAGSNKRLRDSDPFGLCAEVDSLLEAHKLDQENQEMDLNPRKKTKLDSESWFTQNALSKSYLYRWRKYICAFIFILFLIALFCDHILIFLR